MKKELILYGLEAWSSHGLDPQRQIIIHTDRKGWQTPLPFNEVASEALKLIESQQSLICQLKAAPEGRILLEMQEQIRSLAKGADELRARNENQAKQIHDLRKAVQTPSPLSSLEGADGGSAVSLGVKAAIGLWHQMDGPAARITSPAIKDCKPMTERQIIEMYETPELAGRAFGSAALRLIAVVRAVEHAHGIGSK